MKYNQPFDQPTSPDAPYINGNPSTGTPGSIPPAAAFEYPQRELVALITEAGLTPDNGDLAQVLKAIQLVDVCNVLKSATNGGDAKNWSATIPALPISPPPPNTALWFKPGLASVPGGTVFSLNGSAFHPVVMQDGSAIGLGDITATSWLLLFFDGSEWIVVVGGRPIGQLPLLHTNANWYVNASIGNDSYDGTQPTVSGSSGPFATIQRAVTETLKYNMNGYSQFIFVADGTYSGLVGLPQPNGAGIMYLIGNVANPAACQIIGHAAPNTTSAIACNGGTWYVDGFRISTETGTFIGDPGTGIAANFGQANLTIGNVRFGPCAGPHIGVTLSATVRLFGHDGVSAANVTIESGANAVAHMQCGAAGNIQIPGLTSQNPNLTILGPVAFSSDFAVATTLGDINVQYQSQGGAGIASVTGSRYFVSGNGIINTGGGGANYYPGSIAGSTATGGQYL